MRKEELLGLSFEEKYRLIGEGKYLDVFVNDENWLVRYIVARQGYGLEQLINDKDEDLRKIAKRLLESI